jgi:cytochrome P450
MVDVEQLSGWPLPLDDPYPTLHRLRESGPVHRLPDLNTYLVVSYAEAMAVLQGPEWSSDPSRSRRLATRFHSSAAARDFVAKSLLLSDPPAHTRLRRSLSGYLTPNAVERLRARIGAICDAALCSQEIETLDVMSEIAYPVPLAIICELLDVGPDMAEVLRWETPRMTATLDPMADPEAVETGAAAGFAVMLELVPLVADRKVRPGDDLLSALVAGTDDSPSLEVDEAIVMALLLLAAGHETTANLIGNAVLCLHDHPDAVRRLRARPEVLPAAVEELLRFEPPVQLTSRVANANTKLGEQPIAAGDQVLVSLGGANRDPAAFADPDVLDLDRAPRGSLTFGHGVHFCAGAALARVEAQEVLRRLIQLDPPIEERAMTVERGSSDTFRRVNKLLLH